MLFAQCLWSPRDWLAKSKDFFCQLPDLLILLIVALLPAVFDLRGYNIFELPKAVVFCFLVELLFLSWLIKILLSGKYFIFRAKWPLLLTLGLLLINILSAWHSLDSKISWQGSYWRQQGLWLWLHGCLFFFIVWSQLKARLIKKIAIAASLSASLISLYALAQILGWDFTKWQEDPALTWRAFASFGQPNFLGAWLLLAWPWTWLAGQLVQEKISRRLLLFSLLLQLAALFFTLSRTIWLALIIQLFVGVLYKLFKKDFRRTALALLIIVALAAAVYLGVVIKNRSQVLALPKSDQSAVETIKYRWQTLFYWQYGSLGSRLQFWQAAGQALPQLPLWGWGQESQSLVLARFYQSTWSYYEKINTIPDRAHNQIFDLLLTVGWLGLLATAAFWLFWLLAISRAVLCQPEQKIFVALALMLIGQGAVNLFNFTTVTTAAYLWLAAAAAAAYLYPVSYQILPAWRRLVKIFCLAAAALVAVFCYWQAACSFYADRYFRLAKNWEYFGSYDKTLSNYQVVFRLAGEKDFYHWQFAQSLLNYVGQVQTPAEAQKMMQLAAEQFTSGQQRIMPFDYLLAQARVLNYLAFYQADAASFALAQQAWQQLQPRAPQLARLYLDWSKLYLWRGQYLLADQLQQRALALYPDLVDWRLNSEHRAAIQTEQSLLYEDRGTLHFAQKDFIQAQADFLAAYRLAIRPELLKKIAAASQQAGQTAAAAQWFEHAARCSPQN